MEEILYSESICFFMYSKFFILKDKNTKKANWREALQNIYKFKQESTFLKILTPFN